MLINEGDLDAITRIFSLGLPRTLARHAVIVLHYFRSVSDEVIPIDVFVAGCVLYALKQRQCPNGNHAVKRCLARAKESDIVGFELVLVQVIRRNVVLVEACLRSVFHDFLLVNPTARFDRERLIQVCLHLISVLYNTKWCLFPESAARGALVVACEKCDLDVRKLPPKFEEQTVTQISEYLRCSSCK
ncbi:hypothetical protein DQ04_01521020 [Trypanosoma grayi]|uniref:hypothetical protein n=1 Tax=Trypanosoma grayi TaxID=71804 RepID=UPI0004F47F8A|nr:hypothetical protein DQ04_01521020 [Trypanosoma grayi]KEG12675.1 hypothetical protein DQ04_01521020 [Trypanosoma grayi]